MRRGFLVICAILLFSAVTSAAAQQARPGNLFPPQPTPVFLSGDRANIAKDSSVLTLKGTPPAAQGDVRFVAPGVTIGGLVNTSSHERWMRPVPWAKDMEIVDAASVTLYFSANAQALTVFEVRLLDVHPSGERELLARDSQQFVTAVSPTPVSFFMNAQGRTLWEGHFLELQVFAQTGNVAVVLQYGGATPSGLRDLNLRWLDSDGDGVSDSDERREKTNPLDGADFKERWRDSDDDGLTDYFERSVGSDPTRADTDGDGFGDGVEVYAGSDPLNRASRPRDQNNNGLPDSFETNYYNNTTINQGGGVDPGADPDRDGCNNLCEAAHGTDPNDPDTDDDGIRDGDEILGGTDPNEGPGGLRDGDGDGLTDAMERSLGTDPDRRDTDGDGFGDGTEFFQGTDPRDANNFPRDDDRDGLPDVFEIRYFNTTNVLPGDDPDQDGCDNACEADHGTDPTDPDTDGDGTDDGAEIDGQTDPRVPGPSPVRRPDRMELQAGAGMFALVAILSLFGILRWKP